MNSYSHPSREIGNDGSNRVENSKFCYEQINHWISNADNKVNISCAVFTVVFTAFSFISGFVISSPADPIMLYVYRLLMFVSLVLFFFSVMFYARALSPNLMSIQNDTSNNKYPIFFMDVADMELDEYKSQISISTENDFIDELCQEIWINSQICKKKMINYKQGIKLSKYSIYFAFGAFVLKIMSANSDFVISLFAFD